MKIPIEIVNSAIDGVPEISLRGMIDNYEDGSIASAIDSCGGSKLRMNINSMGGSINLGQEVIAAMQSFKNNGGIIETVNRGIAYSTAGWIFSAGTKGYRKMMPFATLMTHPPMFADGTTLADYQQGSEKWNILSDAMDKLIDIFVPITNRTKAIIKRFMTNSTTFNAKQAIKEGFADEVIEISNVVVLKNNLQPEEIINATESIDYEIINKPEPGNTNNNKNMDELAKLLNVHPDKIMDAVKGLINRAENSEAAKVALETTNEQLKAEKESLRNELSQLKDAEILNYVNKYIGTDKTREEKRDKLMNMAKSDFDTFKEVCSIEPVVNAGAPIDKGIKPEGKEGDELTDLTDAKKFLNMSLSEKEALRKKDVSEYNKLVNAYDKNSAKIF